jgi:hypothetical protein
MNEVNYAMKLAHIAQDLMDHTGSSLAGMARIHHAPYLAAISHSFTSMIRRSTL